MTFNKPRLEGLAWDKHTRFIVTSIRDETKNVSKHLFSLKVLLLKSGGKHDIDVVNVMTVTEIGNSV
jgi:hypothetical protein